MTGNSPRESSVPLVTVISDQGELADFTNEFGRRRMQTVWAEDRLACCSPVYASDAVRRAVLSIIIAAAAIYAYFAVFPPGFINIATTALHLPDFMAHVIVGVLPALIASFTLRGQLARRFMVMGKDQAPSILSDAELVDKVLSTTPAHVPVWMGGCWLPVLLLAGLTVLKLLVPRLCIFYTLAFYLPAAVVGALGLNGGRVVADVIRMSRALAESLCCRLEAGLAELAAAESKQPGSETHHAEAQDVAFWQDLTRQHMAMDAKLEELWLLENAGRMLLVDVGCRVVLIMPLLFVTLVSQNLCVEVLALFATCLSVVRMLQFLVPVAEVTSLCQSAGSNQRSILRLTTRFVNHPQLSDKANAAQARFLQYISVAPAGIELPVLGLVTMTTLANAAKVVGAVGPTVLTFMLKGRSA